MPTVSDAAVTAVMFAALYAGHQLGDHVVQTNAVAMSKAAPAPDLVAAGVHPWHGWGACLRHVGTYTLVQAAAVAAIWVVAPLRPSGVLAGLAVSASTHAVIDRRWVVRLLIRAKGCQDWPQGPYLIDLLCTTGGR